MKKIFAFLLGALIANVVFSQVSPYPTGTGILPSAIVTCLNGSSGSVDYAALQAAATTGGTIVVLGNCTINNTITVGSNTDFNWNGSTVTASAAANWPSSTIAAAITASTNATKITVQNGKFVWTGAGGGIHILNFPSGNQTIKVLNNWSTGAGDLAAFVGVTDGLAQGNTCLASLNACYDAWYGATDIKYIGNYASMAANTGSTCMQFTGFNTGGAATLTTGFTAIGNTCYLGNANVEIGINVNGFAGSCTGAKDDQDVIADNRIYIYAGTYAPAIRFSGCGSYAEVHDNLIFSDGATTSSYPAIEAQSSWTGVHMHHNMAYGWLGPTSGSDDGVFNNQSPKGSIGFNECMGTCSTLLVGAIDTTTQIFGNDTGTGITKATSATGNAPFVAETTGNGGFNAALDVVGPNLTGGNHSTIHFGQSATTGNCVQQEFGYAGSNNGGNNYGISMCGTGVDFVHYIYFPDELDLGDSGSIFNENGVTFEVNGQTVGGGTTFTVSGCGTIATISGDATGGRFTCATGATPATLVFVPNGATNSTAPHMWICVAQDTTTSANVLTQTAFATTSCTVTGTVATSDVIAISMTAH